MRKHLAGIVALLAFAGVGLSTKAAHAQRVVVEERADYARFRWGIDLAGGGVFLNQTSVGVVGVDARFGVQLNNFIGIYAEPQLVFGGGDTFQHSGFDGVFGVTGVVDFTFDRLFLGAGAGLAYTGVNNFYASPEGEFRIGFYPIVAHGFRGRRRGLMIGAEVHFIDWAVPGNPLALVEPTFTIGYEAF